MSDRRPARLGRVWPLPRLVAALRGEPCAAVAAGHYFSGVVTRAGAVFTWGSGLCWQLGLGSNHHQQAPQQASWIARFSAFGPRMLNPADGDAACSHYGLLSDEPMAVCFLVACTRALYAAEAAWRSHFLCFYAGHDPSRSCLCLCLCLCWVASMLC